MNTLLNIKFHYLFTRCTSLPVHKSALHYLFTRVHFITCSRECTSVPVHKSALHCLFTRVHFITCSQECTSLPVHKSALHYLFTTVHFITCSQECTSLPVHKSARHYLFTRVHVITMFATVHFITMLTRVYYLFQCCASWIKYPPHIPISLSSCLGFSHKVVIPKLCMDFSCVSCPHLIQFNLIITGTFDKEYILWWFVLCTILCLPIPSSFLGPNILLSNLYWNLYRDLLGPELNCCNSGGHTWCYWPVYFHISVWNKDDTNYNKNDSKETNHLSYTGFV
jgi:hypothetical protein